MDSMQIARPYADAFFHLASQKGQLDEILALLSQLSQLASHAAFCAVLGDPSCTEAKQLLLLPKLVAVHTPLQQRIVRLLVQRKRVLLAPDIYRSFQQHIDTAQGQESAIITSAQPLTDAQQAQLCKQLEQKRQTRIHAEFHTDCSLIGGYKIQIGDSVENRTIRYQLTQMKNALIQQQDTHYGSH